MIHATTQRLILRDLERPDLLQHARLVGDWSVSQWLSVVPHPYGLQDSEAFFAKLQSEIGTIGCERFYAIALADTNALIGGVGVRGERSSTPDPGTTVVGYWIGKPYWGLGYMSEALDEAIKVAFAPSHVAQVKATTHPDNKASMNVLRKAGFAYLGAHPVSEPNLWGRTEETRWVLRREDYARTKNVSS
ncbi:MAG: GNAT family protein [Bdellovibrionales bacterium]